MQHSTKTAMPHSITKIAKLIHSARLHKGFTQSELAKKCKMTHQYISQIEQGKVNLTFETLERLCSALNYCVEIILISNNTMAKPPND